MNHHEAALEASTPFDSEQARVEAWLDENPDFFKSYLLRKGTRTLIDAWLVAHALPPGVALQNVHEEVSDDEDLMPVSTHRHHEHDPINGNDGGGSGTPSSTGGIIIPKPATAAAGSKCSSGSGTPVRKISAHEFERGGLTKPLINNIDGNPTFLSPNVPAEVTGQIRKRSRNDVQGLNETELIFELVKDICNDLDIRSLCHKILQNVGILTSADRWVKKQSSFPLGLFLPWLFCHFVFK